MVMRTTQALKKINKLISPQCNKYCPESNERCCDAIFCGLVEDRLKETGEADNYEKPGYLGVPYLSETGCVIPIEKRPLCTCFICPFMADHLKKKKKHTQWFQLQSFIREKLKI